MSRLAKSPTASNATSDAAIAARALPLIDLTNLDDACTTRDVEALSVKAVMSFGSVAALCVWPRFIATAKRALSNTPVKVATVVNFPQGGTDTLEIVAETQRAIAEGADEIDLVMPYRAYLAGRRGFAETQIVRVRQALPQNVILKIILETGEIADPNAIAAMGEMAIEAGADFLKTSTGKVKTNATPEAARVLLNVIARSRRPVGLKVAGGIRSIANAILYLTIADEIMGPDWANDPTHFRFGASGLLDALLAALKDGPAITVADY